MTPIPQGANKVTITLDYGSGDVPAKWRVSINSLTTVAEMMGLNEGLAAMEVKAVRVVRPKM